MFHYVLGRFINAIIILLVIASIVFVLVRLSGDPAELLLPTNATEEQIQFLREKLELDRPLWVQYLVFMRNLLTRGDLGQSFRYNKPALNLVLRSLPATARLALSAILVALMIGIPAGVISGLHPGSFIDVAVQSLTLLGQCMPTFWIGIMLILVFAVRLGWLPVMGLGGLRHLVLPAVTLGLTTAALIARMLRAAIFEITYEDYTRTARAKGLPERIVVWKHIFRNALIPVITILMVQVGYLMGGSVVTETVFNYPGMGLLAVQSILGRDYAVVQTFVIFTGIIVVTANLLADISYGIVDPRIRRN
ncbi:ABC transporter permease [Candidatus Bipolaricaulota bacterium]